jgi:hypothetical protein
MLMQMVWNGSTTFGWAYFRTSKCPFATAQLQIVSSQGLQFPWAHSFKTSQCPPSAALLKVSSIPWNGCTLELPGAADLQAPTAPKKVSTLVAGLHPPRPDLKLHSNKFYKRLVLFLDDQFGICHNGKVSVLCIDRELLRFDSTQ